jgi:integrase
MAKKRSANRQNGGPRTLHRLTATFVRVVKKKDTYSDGGGLFLQVGIGGSAKSWIFIYRRVRLAGDDSHERFIKALEHERRTIPSPRDRDRVDKLLKIARAIIKEHERNYAAHEISGGCKKSELIQAAERYIEDRRKGYVGLGSVNAVSLAGAREKAAECRAMLAENPPRDPRTEFRRWTREQAKLNAKTKNFYDMTISYIAARENDPDKPMHVSTRKSHLGSLKNHLVPLHKKLPEEITAQDIYDIIQPLRKKGRRSAAHKSRMLALRVIEWARANEAFPAAVINPASMEPGSRLRVLLNTESTDSSPYAKSHPALHFSKIPALFTSLDSIERREDFLLTEAERATGKAVGTLYNAIRSGRLLAYKPERPFSSRSMDHWLVKRVELFKFSPQIAEVIPGLPSVALYVLKYQILTASRPNEPLGMRWSEWEEEDQVWHVPWQRTKQGGQTRQDHYVPLSDPATAILNAMREQQRRDNMSTAPTDFVFGTYWTPDITSARIGIPPCKATIRNLLEKHVDKTDVDKTLHGMRTAFSSWATRLGYQERDIERGLSHAKGYGSEPLVRIYNRDAFNRDAYDREAIREDPLRALFAAWGNYCLYGQLPADRALRKPAEVVSIPRHQSMK